MGGLEGSDAGVAGWLAGRVAGWLAWVAWVELYESKIKDAIVWVKERGAGLAGWLAGRLAGCLALLA